jgi:hypothetical protein
VGNDPLFEIVQNKVQIVAVQQAVGRVFHGMSSSGSNRFGSYGTILML